MIWTFGVFTEWLKDRNRLQLEFQSSDMLIIGCIVIGMLLLLNLLIW